jgi:hypothetical protein
MTTETRQRDVAGKEEERTKPLGGKACFIPFFLPHFIPFFFLPSGAGGWTQPPGSGPFTLPVSLVVPTSSIIRSYRHQVTKSMTSAATLLLPPLLLMLKRKRRTLGSLLRTWWHLLLLLHSSQTLNSLSLSLNSIPFNSTQFNSIRFAFRNKVVESSFN